jgi:hypothetical protein
MAKRRALAWQTTVLLALAGVHAVRSGDTITFTFDSGSDKDPRDARVADCEALTETRS